MTDKVRIAKWLKREWEGYLIECDDASEAAEYAIGDCAADLGLEIGFVREVVVEVIRAGV